jgi:hypothetical protein
MSIMTTTTRYQVACRRQNQSVPYCHLAPEDYSGYRDREKAKANGRLDEGELVYGLEQAREHIAEVQARETTHKEIFTIEQVIKIASVVETYNPHKA